MPAGVRLQPGRSPVRVTAGITAPRARVGRQHVLRLWRSERPRSARLRVSGAERATSSGEFRPRPEVAGIPGITHGGALYTTMDCMATWAGMALKRTKALWVLRSATMTYHRPAHAGDPISLRRRSKRKAATGMRCRSASMPTTPMGNCSWRDSSRSFRCPGSFKALSAFRSAPASLDRLRVRPSGPDLAARCRLTLNRSARYQPSPDASSPTAVDAKDRIRLSRGRWRCMYTGSMFTFMTAPPALHVLLADPVRRRIMELMHGMPGR